MSFREDAGPPPWYVPPAPPVAPAPLPAEYPWRLAGPIAILLAGVLCLAFTAHEEQAWLDTQPWTQALTVLGDNRPPAQEALLLWARTVTREHPAPGDELLAELQKWAQEEDFDLDIDQAERVLALEAPPETLSPLLASGRLPAPGMPEVLAGDLARDAPFTLDGVPFEIVGRMHQGVSGLGFTYLLPFDAAIAGHFTPEAGALRGWLDPEGMTKLDTLFPERQEDAADREEDAAETSEQPGKVLNGLARTPTPYAWSALLGLIIVAWGGALGYMRLFARLATPPTRIFGPVLEETLRRPSLFTGLHVLLYGLFFAAMAAGISQPLISFRIADYMSAVFSEGGLSYIGDAYASGDILQASLATFYNNYVVQTLGFTFGISVVPLALGVFKTAASFVLVGFVMAPLWVGTAANYVFHSLTMVLELEAYIVASFVVTVWAARLLRPPKEPFANQFSRNLRIFIGGAVLTGVMLAIAALYEAASLILLMGAG